MFIFIISIFWQVFTFLAFPKQAFVQALLESWYVSKGLIFQKDSPATYLPFLRMIMIPYHQIVGFSQLSTILLAPISSFFVLYCLFVVSNRWLTGKRRYLPILFYSIWSSSVGQNLFAFTAFEGVVLLLGWIFWIEWLKNPKKILAFMSGLFIGMGLFAAQMNLFFALIVWLSLFFNKKPLRAKVISALAFGLGISIPGIISFIWVASQGGLSELINWTIIYYLKGYYPFSNLGKDPYVVILFFAVHSPLVIYLLSSTQLKKKAFISLAAFSLPLVFWFAVFHPQRFAISLPIYSLLLGMGAESLKTNTPKKLILSKIIIIFVVLLNILAIAVYFVPRYYRYIIKPQPNMVTSALNPADPMAKAVEWIKKQTPETSKILVMGDALFYFEAQRLPANPRAALASEPFTYLPFEEFVNSIKTKVPDYWVSDMRLFDRYPSYGFPTLGENFKKIIACQTILVQFDYWTISQNNSLTNTCISNTEFK